jgi:DNA-binding transcriptional ArsR family regulator
MIHEQLKTPKEAQELPLAEKADAQLVNKAAVVLRAVNHQLRQQMIRHIHQQGRMNVTDLYVKLRLEQSVASQHLAILRKAGFVVTQREGKQIFYSINYEKLKQVQALVKQILNG